MKYKKQEENNTVDHSSQVGTCRTRGINAHTTIIVDIIDTILRVGYASALTHSNDLRAEITHNGCRLAMPNFEASNPVRKGRTAEPACPTPAM